MFQEVLIVDDDPASLYVHHAVVQSMQISERIVLQDNAREALSYLLERCQPPMLGQGCPQLLLLDLNMPELDGFDLLEEIRWRAPDFFNYAKVIVLTTSSHRRDLQLAEQHRLHGYLLKPLTAAKLDALLEER